MKLFVSVGTQLPFDRLLNMVESVIFETNIEVKYQISESNFTSKHGAVYRYLSSNAYNELFEWCDVFISHAGMGSIITALENGKPTIVCPRLYSYNEHRNDHQLATLNRFSNYPFIKVANNKSELESALKSLENLAGQKVNLEVEESLLKFLKEIIS